MGRSCCVPLCKSNYRACTPNVSTFQFPKNPERREHWKKKILREDLKVTRHSVVCIKHFDPRFIISSDSFRMTGGNIIEVPRQIPKLATDAFPSIFPEWPDRKTVLLPLKRLEPNERAEKIRQRQLQEKRKAELASIKAAENAQLADIAADEIESFNDFKNSLPYKNIKPFTAAFKESYVVFFKMDDENFSSVPATKVFFKVCNNLDVKVFINDETISIDKYRHLLGENLKCDQWCKFSSMITSLGSSSPITLFDKIKSFVENTTKALEGRDDLDNEILRKLKFLLEQLNLVTIPVPRYSPEMLTWAAALFDAHPSGYKFLRKSKHLTLPNPTHLRKFFGDLSKIITGSDDGNSGIECGGETSLALQQLCQSLELDAPVSDNSDDGNLAVECEGATSLESQQFCQSWELSAPVSDSTDHTYSLGDERKKKKKKLSKF